MPYGVAEVEAAVTEVGQGVRAYEDLDAQMQVVMDQLGLHKYAHVLTVFLMLVAMALSIASLVAPYVHK